MPFQTGHTFDLETGERLLLSDICADTEEELRDAMTIMDKVLDSVDKMI